MPTFEDVQSAARVLAGQALRTPVKTSAAIDAALDATLFFKCENLQRGGAFKFRGAFNTLSRLPAEQLQRGVAAYSSGNHAQAVALAAKLLGTTATIVMPQDAPEVKVALTASHGARIIRYDRYREDRIAICRGLAEKDGMAIVPPFDHEQVIAGQGTAALELFEDVGELDALFMPLGGGGLLAGALLVAERLRPRCRVYGVEPLAGNDGQQSLREGRRVRIDTPQTIADGAQTQQLGELSFPIIQRAVTDILAVDDGQLLDATLELGELLGCPVEPTGCLGYAGARTMGDSLRGLRVGVIVSGGNADPTVLGRAGATRAAAQGLLRPR
ncbi:MAG TPA: pyridoxal-phosphate dependent enzyme [Steroidobacteraceae bacterium]|nr:pyridoxal-phosphate dependent enzyme [Steroidobacteraceae bacterium]